ncbi:hypothetical protein WJX84_005410 [Apatococcus fuscideae]|uniref:Uncharacterized protein n=1 Tax=Apatococcus fuscideae TaxID=2026836 RepID=A0AAW1SJN8_9CHLO
MMSPSESEDDFFPSELSPCQLKLSARRFGHIVAALKFHQANITENAEAILAHAHQAHANSSASSIISSAPSLSEQGAAAWRAFAKNGTLMPAAFQVEPDSPPAQDRSLSRRNGQFPAESRPLSKPMPPPYLRQCSTYSPTPNTAPLRPVSRFESAWAAIQATQHTHDAPEAGCHQPSRRRLPSKAAFPQKDQEPGSSWAGEEQVGTSDIETMSEASFAHAVPYSSHLPQQPSSGVRPPAAATVSLPPKIGCSSSDDASSLPDEPPAESSPTVGRHGKPVAQRSPGRTHHMGSAPSRPKMVVCLWDSEMSGAGVLQQPTGARSAAAHRQHRRLSGGQPRPHQPANSNLLGEPGSSSDIPSAHGSNGFATAGGRLPSPPHHIQAYLKGCLPRLTSRSLSLAPSILERHVPLLEPDMAMAGSASAPISPVAGGRKRGVEDAAAKTGHGVGWGTVLIPPCQQASGGSGHVRQSPSLNPPQQADGKALHQADQPGGVTEADAQAAEQSLKALQMEIR